MIAPAFSCSPSYDEADEHANGDHGRAHRQALVIPEAGDAAQAERFTAQYNARALSASGRECLRICRTRH